MAVDAEVEDTIEEDVEEVPYAATADLSGMDGKNLKNVPAEGEDVEITLDLGSLRESVKELQAEIDEELTFNEDDLADILSEDEKEELEVAEKEEEPEGEETPFPPPPTTNEDIEISEDFINDLVEKLTVDMGADLSGWAGRPAFQQQEEMEKELAHRRSTEVVEKMKDLKQAQEELVFENKQLTKKLTQYGQVTTELKETLQTVNLSNARLLYTNRVLRSTSLNERQKNRIVEAISRADSVTEAKTIYNTLESTVESAPMRGPKSLSEAINRPTSVIRATRKESKQTDPFAERMRRLAGIK